MSACSKLVAILQLLMKSSGIGFSNPSQEATLAEHDVKMFDVSPMMEMFGVEVLLTTFAGRVLLNGRFVAMHV